MIKSKEELKEYLNYEFSKYCFKNYLEYCLLFLFGSERAVIWNYQRRLRITEYHRNSGNSIRYGISRIIFNHKSNKFGMHISLNVFDKGLKIMHLGPILINGNARVGKNCSIHINTSIVAHGVKCGAPILGDDIVIGVGTVILGEIVIGDNTAIGANSLVNKSFETGNMAIGGVPSQYISNNGTKKWNK